MSSAPATARPLMPGKLPVATVAVLVVAAAIANLLLGGSFSGGGDAPAVRPAATARQTIAHDGLRLQVPGGWARGGAATVPGFNRPLGLSNAGERRYAEAGRAVSGAAADLRRTMTKVAAAASTASTATPATSTPVRKPAASTPHGIDLSLPLLALLGLFAMFLAVRQTLRVLR